MDNNETPAGVNPKDVAAELVYMTGGIDPDFVSVSEIVTDTLTEKGITDEDVIEEFALEVHSLIASAVVTVAWPGDEDEYIFNDPEEDSDD